MAACSPTCGRTRVTRDLLLPFARGAGTLLAAVLGAVGITGEYRHRTATPTFLAAPVRHRVMAAVGVAVGGIARSQLVGVAGFLVYINLVEPSLLAIPRMQSAYPYLPGGGAGALVHGTGVDEDPVTLLAP